PHSTRRRRDRGSETRRHSCSHHGATRCQPGGTARRQARGSAHARRFPFFQSQDEAVEVERLVPPRNPPHRLRDFSPGASVISAMRPPFSATQEFFVSGYLSV